MITTKKQWRWKGLLGFELDKERSQTLSAIFIRNTTTGAWFSVPCDIKVRGMDSAVRAFLAGQEFWRTKLSNQIAGLLAEDARREVVDQ